MKSIAAMGVQDAQKEYIRLTGDTSPVRPRRLFSKGVAYTASGEKWINDCEDWNLRFMAYYSKALKRQYPQ